MKARAGKRKKPIPRARGLDERQRADLRLTVGTILRLTVGSAMRGIDRSALAESILSQGLKDVRIGLGPREPGGDDAAG
jgi:hypothetical protein